MDTFQDRYRMLKEGKYKDRLDNKIKEGYFKNNSMLNTAKILKKTTLSDEDMGALVGVSKQSAMGWKNGVSPKPIFIYEYARIYDLPVDWLLGTSEVDNPNMQQSYAPFEELGFSYEAYQNLLQLKQSGKNMKKFMQGINYMLEYKQYAPIARRDYYVIIDELNNFFSLYPNGLGKTISGMYLTILLDEIKEESAITLTEQSVFPKLLSKMESQKVSTLDNASLAALNDNLKKCKAKIVAEKLAEYKVERDSVYEPLNEDYISLCSLDSYYNPKPTEHIFNFPPRNKDKKKTINNDFDFDEE